MDFKVTRVPGKVCPKCKMNKWIVPDEFKPNNEFGYSEVSTKKLSHKEIESRQKANEKIFKDKAMCWMCNYKDFNAMIIGNGMQLARAIGARD